MGRLFHCLRGSFTTPGSDDFNSQLFLLCYQRKTSQSWASYFSFQISRLLKVKPAVLFRDLTIQTIKASFYFYSVETHYLWFFSIILICGRVWNFFLLDCGCINESGDLLHSLHSMSFICRKVSQFCPLIEILEESPWEFNPTGLEVRNCLKIMLNLILCKSPECDLKPRETNVE